MQRTVTTCLLLFSLGCGSSEPQGGVATAKEEVEVTNVTSDFVGSEAPHAAKSITLVKQLSQDGYQLINYRREPAVPFDTAALADFVRSGELPEGKLLERAKPFRWSIEARKPETSFAFPDTIWYYDQSFLQGDWNRSFSPEIVAEVKTEWKKITTAYGPGLHDAGARLLDILALVLDTPKKYQETPYIDVRESEDCTYVEAVAFADDYWLHVFVTDRRVPQRESIVTIWFTPHIPDQHAEPLEDEVNLLLIDQFRDVK